MTTSPQHRVRLIIAVVLIACTIIAVAVPAYGQTRDELPPPGATTERPAEEQSNDAASEAEVEAVARDLEITMTQARIALEMTPEVDQLQAEAKKKYPDTFAGLWR